MARTALTRAGCLNMLIEVKTDATRSIETNEW